MNGINKNTDGEKYRETTAYDDDVEGATFRVYMKSGHVLRLDNVTKLVTCDMGNFLKFEFTQDENPNEEFFYIDISKDTVDAVSKVNTKSR